MRAVDSFPANGFFSGSRTFEIRSIPAGARIRSARITVTPIADGSGRVGPAVETLTFLDADDNPLVAVDLNDRTRPTGVSKTNRSGNPPWTEIVLGGRRTLDGVEGQHLVGSTLQVDVGGLFVEVDANGTIPIADEPFTLSSNDADLPGLTVSRMKLRAGGADPDVPNVQALTLMAIGSNLLLRFAEQPPVWAHPGELTSPVTSPELAEFLQAALDAAKEEGGFAVVPVALKTDTTALLALSSEVEFDEVRSGLPDGLTEVRLEYGHGGASAAGDDLLTITVPGGAELDPAATRVEIAGSFEASEITWGPLVDRAPASSLAVAAGEAAAQPVSVPAETVVDAIDILVSTADVSATLEVDIRKDFDGKPGDVSLLAARARIGIDKSRHAKPTWVSAALGQSLALAPADPATGKPRVWIVVQSARGTAAWHLNPSEGTAELQTSKNGGLSWRPARVAGLDGALAADLRLRRATPVFHMPVSVEIGRGAEAEMLSLDEFEPLGRVEFALNSNGLAARVNDVLGKRRAVACPRGEQLENGQFADRPLEGTYAPAGWSVSGGVITTRQVFVSNVPGLNARIVAIGDRESPISISQVLPASGGCEYELLVRGFQEEQASRVELIWRGDGCSVSRVDTLTPAVFMADDGIASVAAAALTFMPSARLRVTAPVEARQVEVRAVSGDDAELFVDAISLVGGLQAIRNPDFTEIVADEGVVGWTVEPPLETHGDEEFVVGAIGGFVVILNQSTEGRTLSIAQTPPVSAGASYRVEVVARSAVLEAATSVPSASLTWLTADGAAIDPPVVAAIVENGAERVRLQGEVPASAAEVEVRIAVPPNTVLAVANVSAEFSQPTEIPISFLAESPGTLHIRDFRVGFREAPLPVAPEPEEGPCLPTPSDVRPEDACGCDPCGKHKGPAPASAPIGTVSVRPRPVVSARGILSASIAGRLAAGSLRTLPMAMLAPLSAPLEIARPVIDVPEVGPARSAALETIGVTSVRHLALANPVDLERRLGFPRALARTLIENANSLLSDRGEPS